MSAKIYQCRGCGKVVKLLVLGSGDLSCCGVPLTFLGQGCAEGSREKCEPPLDLLEVVIGGKSRWEFSESAARPPTSERLQAWKGDAGGLSVFDFLPPVRG